MRKHQILIIGAGVGGSTAAFHMSKAGLDVLMVEKEQFPRDKPCGDGVVPSIHPLLESMGILDDFIKYGNKCHGSALYDSRGERLIRIEPDSFNIAIPRYIGDDIVNKAALKTGVDYLENFEATEVLTERGQATGVRGIYDGKVVELEADLVVLANGSHSMLSRQMGFYEEDPDYVFYGIRGYFDDVEGLPDAIEFHYPDEMFMPAGYIWLFPLGGKKANVGVFITERSLQKTGKTMEELLWWWKDSTKFGKERLGNARIVGKIKGWRLPCGKRRPVHGAGVIAVGDAGNMIEQLYGGGIPHAMVSGVCAARMAAEAVSANDFSENVLKSYEDYVEAELGSGYKIQDVLRSKVFSSMKDISELIEFGKESGQKGGSAGDVMARFLVERRGYTGSTKSAYSK